MNFAVTNTVLSLLWWTQGPLSKQEARLKDQAKQWPMGHMGRWLQVISTKSNP